MDGPVDIIMHINTRETRNATPLQRAANKVALAGAQRWIHMMSKI